MAANTGRFDVGAQRVGNLYAKAMLGAAETGGGTDPLLAELDVLVDEVLNVHPKLNDVLSSEIISPGEKIAVLDRLFANRLSPLLLNFLKVLAQHGRLGFLHAIRTEAHTLSDEMKGRVRVEVTTAVPLSSAQSGEIAVEIRKLLGREPQLVARTDKALLGGIKLRVGDTVYDGSVAAQLRRLRAQIQQSSLQQIETARDTYLATEA